MHNSKSTNTTAIETNQYRRLIEHDHTGEVGRWGANLGGLVYPREGLEQRAAAAAALDRAGVPLQLAEPRLRAAAHRRVPLLLPPRGPRPSAGRRRGGRGEGDVRVVVAAMVDEHLLPVDVDGRHRQPPIGCLRQTGDRNVRDLGGFLGTVGVCGRVANELGGKMGEVAANYSAALRRKGKIRLRGTLVGRVGW
jgi:hypothetical protein